MDIKLKDKIYNLEMSLLNPLVRKSFKQLDKLIADDFCEFSSRGKIYNKQDILEALPFEDSRKFLISNFLSRDLGPKTIIVTYKTTEEYKSCLRTSIWQLIRDEWQIIFHQETKIENRYN